MNNDNLRLAIIDYGVGNIGSIANMLRRYCRIDNPDITCDKDVINDADCLIFPGVGAFDAGVKSIKNHKIYDTLLKIAHDGQKPILATCVGMQLLFNRSEEGTLDGMGFINEKMKKLTPPSSDFKVPHMGWNEIKIVKDDPLFKNLEENRFYFCHSFCAKDIKAGHVIGTANHGEEFTAAIQKNKVWATQFHPEKSHKFGIQLYQNFVEIVKNA